VIKDRPLYRSIVLHIRQKIRGNAETALISYNVADDDWSEIKRILTLHYADKRNLRTLEHQLGQMTQGAKTVDSFYSAVYSHFALIIRCLKNGNQSPEMTNVLVESYRDRALDVFIRGLNGDISILLIIRGPKNLQEAYNICLELQSVTSKTHVSYSNRIPSPHQGFRPVGTPRYPWGFQPNHPAPSNQIAVGYHHQGNPDVGRNPQHSQSYSPPRPAIKMESNQSGNSYRSNLSAQSHGNSSFKRSPSTSINLNPFRKAQRLYHLNAVPFPMGPVTTELDEKSNNDIYYDEPYHGSSANSPNYPLQADEKLRSDGEFANPDEINFMTDASLALHA